MKIFDSRKIQIYPDTIPVPPLAVKIDGRSLGSMVSPPLVVLDTNVFVAAGFNRRSSSASILEAIRAGAVRLVWNEQVRREYRAIVGRIPNLDWSAVEELLTEESRFGPGELNEGGFEQIEDLEDRKFAALAAAANALLVTADQHLLSVRDKVRVTIYKPSELMQRLESELLPPKR